MSELSSARIKILTSSDNNLVALMEDFFPIASFRPIVEKYLSKSSVNELYSFKTRKEIIQQLLVQLIRSKNNEFYEEFYKICDTIASKCKQISSLMKGGQDSTAENPSLSSSSSVETSIQNRLQTKEIEELRANLIKANQEIRKANKDILSLQYEMEKCNKQITLNQETSIAELAKCKEEIDSIKLDLKALKTSSPDVQKPASSTFKLPKFSSDVPSAPKVYRKLIHGMSPIHVYENDSYGTIDWEQLTGGAKYWMKLWNRIVNGDVQPALDFPPLVLTNRNNSVLLHFSLRMNGRTLCLFGSIVNENSPPSSVQVAFKLNFIMDGVTSCIEKAKQVIVWEEKPLAVISPVVYIYWPLPIVDLQMKLLQ